MPEIDEEMIGRRAKALAEADGFEWNLTFRHDPHYQPKSRGAFLSADRRRQYLDRARAEFHKETGNA